MDKVGSTHSGADRGLPEKIGKYEVTRELGVGSTSRVYLCHDPYLGKDVALKLYPAANDLPPGRARTHRRVFFNEAHMVGMLQHPSVVPIHDAGEDSGRYYIVMEYVRNADPLTTWTKPGRLLPIHGVADVIFKCAKALDFAHRRGV
ncbi:MAG TPA: protein kinase, partial [Gammaproteobacteria bacterium]|nr:protein kinase [Gammaproteobacteria bacterium]